MNQLFVNAVTNYTRDKVGDQELEVLHALFSEVTVLGFIALLFGVMIRSGKLHEISDWFFADSAPVRIPHEGHEVFGNLTYNAMQNVTQTMPGTFAISMGSFDIRDGRQLSELTVLFEDIHIILFFIMLALIVVAAVNLHQVKQIVVEWEQSEDLVAKHGQESAFAILTTMVSSPARGWFQRHQLQRHLTYLLFRHEFLHPANGPSPDGVDPDTFPFGEYLRFCAGQAVVENVEVPIWMYLFNSLFVLLLRPVFGWVGHKIVILCLVVPWILCGMFALLLWILRDIEHNIAVDMDEGKLLPDRGPIAYPQGRRFAKEAARNPVAVKKAEAKGVMTWLRQTFDGTLTPTPFERQFLFRRNGPRALALASRLPLFWVAVFVAIWLENIRVFPYTWRMHIWSVPCILFPLGYLLFDLYPQVTFLRLFVDKAYYTFDADNNGFLDAGELRRCLNSLKLAGDELDLSEQDKEDYGAEYVRPPSEEWFQILAPDMRGLSQRRFKVLIWALSSFNDMELDEQQVLDSLQKLHTQSTITAPALFRLVVSLTRLPPTAPVLGKSLLRETYLQRHDSWDLPVGYAAPLPDVARLIVSINHEISHQRGID